LNLVKVKEINGNTKTALATFTSALARTVTSRDSRLLAEPGAYTGNPTG
jgi:hypothetical protein